MRRHAATVAAAAVALLAASLPIGAQQSWVYVLREDGRIAVVDPLTRGVKQTIRLEHASPSTLYPTPGGKFVLVTYRDVPTVSAVDVESHQETRFFALSTGRAADLTFSPMGDVVLTTQSTSGRIDIFSHRRSVLDPLENLTAGVAGAPAIFNRRATRLYRSAGQGLAVVYRKTGEVIAEVIHPGGPMAWGFTPDYRYLWGVSQQADAVAVVDETRLSLVETLTIPHRPHPPVFSQDGSRVYLIDATGRAVIGVDARTRKVAVRIELPTAVTGLAAADGQELWAHDPAGLLYVVDTRRLAVQTRVDLGAPTHQMSYITLRKGEGYACF